MRQLPGISCSSGSLCFPLCDATSQNLETALLAPDVEQRATLLQIALAADPAFFLWAACRAWWCEQLDAATPEAIARWLAPQLLDELTELAHASCSNRETESPAAWRALANGAWQWNNIFRWVELAAGSSPTFDAAELLPPGVAKIASENRTAEGDLSQAAQWWAHDQPHTQRRLPALVARLARLRELETRFDEALEREKLQSLRQLAYGAGHEINNPLANISMRAQTLLKEERDPERRRRLAAINSQAFRAHEMIADLMLFSRPPKLVPAEVDLVQLVDTVS